MHDCSHVHSLIQPDLVLRSCVLFLFLVIKPWIGLIRPMNVTLAVVKFCVVNPESLNEILITCLVYNLVRYPSYSAFEDEFVTYTASNQNMLPRLHRFIQFANRRICNGFVYFQYNKIITYLNNLIILHVQSIKLFSQI